MDGQFGKVRDYLTAALCCAAAVLLDQVTKHLAVAHLKLQREIVLIPGVFELRYLENRGAAFGLFQNRQMFFVCAAVVIFLLIRFFYGRIPGGRRYLPMRICGVLICAGAVGNLIDRIR
ncbi:signal peptidase II, partial [Schaedlerella sp.]|uniref:signal peptidase II n=1 Tax=Schaedlerella sp. TaxID=2676057 RepID=UPI0037459F04